jgi:hypothetical protein
MFALYHANADDTQARASFRTKYGADPAKAIRTGGGLLLGPIPDEAKIMTRCPWCGSQADPEPHQDRRNPLRCPDCGGIGAYEDWLDELQEEKDDE